MRVRGHTGKECLTDHRDELPLECQQAYKGFVQCKRALWDMRKRYAPTRMTHTASVGFRVPNIVRALQCMLRSTSAGHERHDGHLGGTAGGPGGVVAARRGGRGGGGGVSEYAGGGSVGAGGVDVRGMLAASDDMDVIGGMDASGDETLTGESARTGVEARITGGRTGSAPGVDVRGGGAVAAAAAAAAAAAGGGSDASALLVTNESLRVVGRGSGRRILPDTDAGDGSGRLVSASACVP